MQIGVRLPAAGARVSSQTIVTVARWAEELGFHSLWVSDHVALPEPETINSTYPYPPHKWPYPANTNWLDPLLALAWAAAVAPSLKLSNSVMVAPLRNPILLAKRLASLDYLSGGRVMLGIGVGWMKEEFDLIGASFERRGARTVEMVELMRAFWTGNTVEFQGEFYQVSGCKMHPRPVQPTIPVVWGGHSEAALKRIARVGDGWHPLQLSMEQLAGGLKKLRQFCEQNHRDPDSVLVVVRPNKAYPLNAETHVRHLELGIQHVVVDPPLDGPDLGPFREEMERVAEVCGLQPRR